MSPIRVLIADDHVVVRKGLQMIIGTEPAIQLVGEAKDGDSAVRQVKNLKPDVVVMDLMMPHKDGIQAITDIKRDNPYVKIIVLTTFEYCDKLNAAMEAGADGYLLKDADGEALLQAIKATQYGDVMPLDARIARQLLMEATGQIGQNQSICLTAREKEVLSLVACGLSNKALAEALALTEGTVKIHVSRILSKLNVSSRTEAAMRAVQLGLVSTDGVSPAVVRHLA